MHRDRAAHDCLDFYGMSLDIIQRLDGGLVVNVEHYTDNAETKFALKHFDRHDRILVAGGGFGGTSALLAQAFGVDRVLTYEAQIERVKTMLDAVRVRGRQLEVRHGALTDHDGFGPFFESTSTWPASSIDRDFAPAPHLDTSVPYVDTQRVIQEDQINAMVLDVETAEHVILPHIDLGRLRVLVVEVHGDDDQYAMLRQRITDAGLIVRDEHVNMPTVRVLAATKKR